GEHHERRRNEPEKRHHHAQQCGSTRQRDTDEGEAQPIGKRDEEKHAARAGGDRVDHPPQHAHERRLPVAEALVSHVLIDEGGIVGQVARKKQDYRECKAQRGERRNERDRGGRCHHRKCGWAVCRVQPLRHTRYFSLYKTRVALITVSRQWLFRGTPAFCATRWYLTAGLSTIPSASWSTMARWISCQGVWLSG